MLFCIGFVFQSWPMSAILSPSAMNKRGITQADYSKWIMYGHIQLALYLKRPASTTDPATGMALLETS